MHRTPFGRFGPHRNINIFDLFTLIINGGPVRGESPLDRALSVCIHLFIPYSDALFFFLRFRSFAALRALVGVTQSICDLFV